MEYHEVIHEIDTNKEDVIGVKVPENFQWYMLATFRRDLEDYIVIPLDDSLTEERVFDLVKSHQMYFPGETIVLLYDYNQPYPVDYDLVLY